MNQTVRGVTKGTRGTQRIRVRFSPGVLHKISAARPDRWLATAIVTAAVAIVAQIPAPQAHAAPAPEVEYMYDVAVRRHYNFPNNDALGYGRGICDKVRSGDSYGQLMGDVKNDVTPSDEFAANYLVSYAVNLLCPDLI